MKRAVQAFDQQEFEKAQIQVDELLQDDRYQKQASSWYYRGVIYDQLMRKNMTSDSASNYLEEALKSYQKAMELSKIKSQYYSFAQINLQGLWVYYLNRGVQYYKVEAFEESLEQLSICKQINNTAPHTLLYTAIVAHQADKYKMALEQYEKYIQNHHAEPAVYRALANLIANHFKNIDGAFNVLQQGIQQYPWDIDLLAENYQLLIQTKQLENYQIRLFTQLQNAPTNPIAHYQLAYLYTQINEWEKAALHYQKAFELASLQLESVSQLATLYYNQGAAIINNLTDMDENNFQQTGRDAIEKANEYLGKSAQYFEEAHKISPKNLSTLKALHTLYTRLNKIDKADHITRIMKRLKGGAQLLELE
jgi:tetratricopeptide (TPR) repeat protein